MNQRPYDVVLFGATSFVGRWIAAYLLEHHPDLRWALAARSERKLDALVEKLAPELPAAASLPRILADSTDAASLAAMAEQTRVVLTTVGPYALYGEALVAACVQQGTSYCDLTGEPQFVRRMVDAHHRRAREAGVRIVHCCGFDSVPSDLGTFALQAAAIERHGQPCGRVDMVLRKVRGGFSGGTAASIVNLMAEARDPFVAEVLADPYSLAPGDSGPDPGQLRGARFDEVLDGWTGPFLMAPINERVVRRTNALLDHRYDPEGARFVYQESTWLGRGLGARLRGTGFGIGSRLAEGALKRPALRRMAERRMPAVGEGPSDRSVKKGFFVSELIGRAGTDGPVVRATVKGERDPGYGATAAMIAEAAITAAAEPTSEVVCGVTTPAAGLGRAYVERFRGSPLLSLEVA